jgi:hypothetical protein
MILSLPHTLKYADVFAIAIGRNTFNGPSGSIFLPLAINHASKFATQVGFSKIMLPNGNLCKPNWKTPFLYNI